MKIDSEEKKTEKKMKIDSEEKKFEKNKKIIVKHSTVKIVF